jgi:hypothetical protein
MPGTQAGPEPVWPLIRCLENDAPTFPADQDFSLCGEPTLLGQSDSLTAAVPKQLRACAFHGVSLDSCLDCVKIWAGSQRGRLSAEPRDLMRSANSSVWPP